MKINNKAILAAIMAFSFNLVGCHTMPSYKEGLEVELLTYKNSNISVEEIKTRHDNENVENSIMPLYNVEKDKEFTFNFKSDLTKDSSIGLYDAITVHTDKSCKEESKIYYYSDIQKSDNGSTVKISPMEPVLKTRTDSNNYLNNNCNWGSAPMLYIAIHYDLDSDEIKYLHDPIIIPFTVKSDVTVPNVKATVSKDGRYKLSWDKVEGADRYIIYNLTNGTLTTGERNDVLNGEQNAYFNLSLVKIAETEKTEFDDFSGAEGGIAEIHNETGSYVIGQNYNVNGTFYVTAVSGDKESNLSAACETANLNIPYKVVEDDDIFFGRYKSISDLPLSINVINIDGSITKRNVFYKLQLGENLDGSNRPEYKYQIEGTALTGYVVIESENGQENDYPETIGTLSPSGTYIPEDNINKSPDKSLDTIINPKDKEQSDKNNDSDLISNQKENTQQHIESGNDNKVSTPEKGVYINAESAEEEWLALNMVAGIEDISLEAFPELQNPYTLKDVFYKVYYQNPYILGVCSFSYDYRNLNLKIEYSYDKNQIEDMQKEIQQASADIIKDIIKENMSDEEKRLAIYEYIENNSEYDMDALEDCKNNGYMKEKGNKYEDSFNAYGIIVKKKGVCMSYSEAYKLLCDLAGVKCKVATGYLDGNLPHAWNIIRIEDEWYQVDSTNNGKTSGIPYFLYDANSEISKETSFELDDLFELDKNLEEYESKDNQYEYYTKNQLSANNMNEYENLLEKQIDENTEEVIIRYLGTDFNEDTLIDVVKRVFNKKGIEDKLKDTSYIYKNGYLILRCSNAK